MLQEYEINSKTLAIIPIDNEVSKVLEGESVYYIKKTPTEIIDHSCRYFGSSYLGRFEGTKHILGFNYKAPIIIEETKRIIFFPTASPRLSNCAWINLHNIKSYTKDYKKSIILFKNGSKVRLEISYNSLENQIFRATRLAVLINERIKTKKWVILLIFLFFIPILWYNIK